MEIKEYFSTKYQAHWLEEIRQSDWSAGQFLYELLSKNEIHEFCGNHVRLFLLTEGKKLVSFCTLSDIDDIKNTDLGPWIGFVYTWIMRAGLQKRTAQEKCSSLPEKPGCMKHTDIPFIR